MQNQKRFGAIVALVAVVATLIPTTTPASAGAGPAVTGVPQKATNFEVASGKFVNTIGHGTQSFWADGAPGTDGGGKLLVGPEFDQKTIDASGGAIERFSPANQYVLRGKSDEANVPEGGFALFSLGGAKSIVFEGRKEIISLPFMKTFNHLVLVRGLYADAPDGDEDRNVTATITGFKSGHALYMRYPGNPNGGFVSEGQLKQMLATSSTKGTNCGSTGCNGGTYITALDLNTGAYTVVLYTPKDNKFTLIDSNMD